MFWKILEGQLPSCPPDWGPATLPVGWLWFTLLAVQIYNLSFKFPTQTELHYLTATSSSDTISSYRKTSVLLKLSNGTLQFFTSTAKISCWKAHLLIGVGYSLWNLLKISRWTLKNSVDVPRNVRRHCLGVRWCDDVLLRCWYGWNA